MTSPTRTFKLRLLGPLAPVWAMAMVAALVLVLTDAPSAVVALVAGALGAAVAGVAAFERSGEVIRIRVETLEGRLKAIERRAPAGEPARALDPMERLSGPEIEVMRLVGSGATTAEIAATLALTPRAVRGHLSAIARKLELDSPEEVRRRAEALGAQWRP